MLWLLVCKVEDFPKTPDLAPRPTDQQQADFYVRLGMAIAAWQFVETSLASIYAHVVGAKNRDSLLAAFHKPTNFRTRLDMTNEAVNYAGLGDTLTPVWDKLYEKAVKKSKRRNDLAHAIVYFQPSRPKLSDQLFLAQNMHDPSRFSGKFDQADIISQAEVESMMASFNDLSMALHQFFEALTQHARSSA